MGAKILKVVQEMQRSPAIEETYPLLLLETGLL